MTHPTDHCFPDLQAMAQELLRLLADADALSHVRMEQERWYTFEDIMRVTGFGKDKLRRLVKERRIPMFRVEEGKRGQWRITQRAWGGTEERLVREGLLTARRHIRMLYAIQNEKVIAKLDNDKAD